MRGEGGVCGVCHAEAASVMLSAVEASPGEIPRLRYGWTRLERSALGMRRFGFARNDSSVSFLERQFGSVSLGMTSDGAWSCHSDSSELAAE